MIRSGRFVSRSQSIFDVFRMRSQSLSSCPGGASASKTLFRSGTHSVVVGFHHVALVAFGAVLCSRAATVLAQPCELAAKVNGPADLVDRFESELALLAVHAPIANCPHVAVTLTREGQSVGVVMTDTHGRRATRSVSELSTAASIVASWATELPAAVADPDVERRLTCAGGECTQTCRPGATCYFSCLGRGCIQTCEAGSTSVACPPGSAP